MTINYGNNALTARLNKEFVYINVAHIIQTGVTNLFMHILEIKTYDYDLY